MNREPSPSVLGIESIATPASPGEAAETLGRLALASRRSFLGRGVAAAAVPAVVLAASPDARAMGGNNTTRNADKNNNANAGVPNLFASLYPGSTKSTFQEIQKDEATHVDILIAAIRSLGGTPRPFPTFQGIQNLTASQFLSAAIAFENTGVHAYFGAAPHIQNPNVVGVALSIALVEAYHSGFLNRLGNVPLIPDGLTYATPYTIDQVLAAAGPFVASLNDNGMFPLTFSTTPSPANDIAILNFALALEYLEAAFYYYNVPRLFA